MTPQLPPPTPRGGTAIVIGGSIAGLLAARVLSDPFERVTIVDRDTFPDHPAPRKGVPQSPHIHTLLGQGARLLQQLFPGLLEELSDAGATTLEWGYDVLLFSFGVWFKRVHSGLFTRIASRELLEFAVRRRVAALGNVTFLETHEVVGLLANATQSGVAGLRTRRRAEAGTETLPANFVVDASGRTSRAPDWLKALGYAAPAETNVNSFLGYATRQFTPPAGWSADWKGLTLRGRAPFVNRGGALYAIEGGRWIVTLAGAGRDYPPLDDDGFLAFAQCLGDPPLLAEAIRRAQPLGPAVGFQRTDNRWRHYEQLGHWPDNFALLGDAACAFNPLYGQGMSVAGLDALTLDQCLRQAPDRDHWTGLGQRFQRALARGLTGPWLLATGEDYRVPQTEGPRPSRAMRVMHAYVDRIAVASAYSPRVCLAFVRVAQLASPPAALFSPGIVARALFTPQRGPNRPPPADAPPATR